MDKELYNEASRFFNNGTGELSLAARLKMLDRDYAGSSYDDMISAQGILFYEKDPAFDGIRLNLIKESLQASEEMVRANAVILLAFAKRKGAYSESEKNQLVWFEEKLLMDDSEAVRKNASAML